MDHPEGGNGAAQDEKTSSMAAYAGGSQRGTLLVGTRSLHGDTAY